MSPYPRSLGSPTWIGPRPGKRCSVFLTEGLRSGILGAGKASALLAAHSHGGGGPLGKIWLQMRWPSCPTPCSGLLPTLSGRRETAFLLRSESRSSSQVGRGHERSLMDSLSASDGLTVTGQWGSSQGFWWGPSLSLSWNPLSRNRQAGAGLSEGVGSGRSQGTHSPIPQDPVRRRTGVEEPLLTAGAHPPFVHSPASTRPDRRSIFSNPWTLSAHPHWLRRVSPAVAPRPPPQPHQGSLVCSTCFGAACGGTPIHGACQHPCPCTFRFPTPHFYEKPGLSGQGPRGCHVQTGTLPTLCLVSPTLWTPPPLLWPPQHSSLPAPGVLLLSCASMLPAPLSLSLGSSFIFPLFCLVNLIYLF